MKRLMRVIWIFDAWTSRVRSPSPALYIEVMLMRNKEIKATLEAFE